MNELVIGNRGQVGAALQQVLGCIGVDLGEAVTLKIDVIHIAFGYSKDYEQAVKNYQKQYNPRLTILHSTVPVGTSRKLGAVHSPIHGVHHSAGGLVDGIKTFVKYIGAVKREDAELVLRLFQEKGIKGYIVKNPETSELSKLGCTTRHGLMIMEQKLFKKRCDEVGADFQEAYTQWNGHYTEGYRVLGMPYVQRPILKDMPGPLGGHCIVPNLDLIGGPVAEFVKEQNAKL